MERCKKSFLLIILLLTACLLYACADTAQPTELSTESTPAQEEYAVNTTLTVVGDAVEGGEYVCDLASMYADTPYNAVYSTINNWPSKRAYAAAGVRIADILAAAGVTDYAKVNFTSQDGYNFSMTKEQLTEPRYHYPKLLEDDESGAIPVECIIALQFREDSWDLADVRPENPCLIIGMSNFYEHTNPIFIENISQLIVSNEAPQPWEAADTYPSPGDVRVGDAIKLQHESFGLVKIHYTLDGSDPTVLSPMYNPSTYQPELNGPLYAETPGELVIKTLVTGYGRPNSEIGEYHFTVTE